MNGIEKITARIAAEARAEAGAVQAAGEEKARGIRAKYEKKAREEYEKLLQAGRAETEQRVQRLNRTARLEAKKDMLALKQEMVAAAYSRAKEKILAMPEEKYAEFLARQAAAAVVTGEEELILNGKDRASVGQQVVQAANAAAAAKGKKAGLTLSDETRPISGGLVLRHGDIEVNCTLDSLLELARGELDAEVAGILFR